MNTYCGYATVENWGGNDVNVQYMPALKDIFKLEIC